MGLFDIFRLKTALSALQDRVETLEREQKQLELEWSSTFDNMRRLYSKIAKRDQRADETRQDAPGSHEPEPTTGNMDERIRASRRRPV